MWYKYKEEIIKYVLNNFMVQLPFLIVSCWVLPRSWGKIKEALTFKNKQLVQPWIDILSFLALKSIIIFSFRPSILFAEQVPSFLIFPHFVFVCIVAPIAEECFFRYLIFEIFDKDTWTPYLISFFGFMSAHLGYLIFPINFSNFLEWTLAYGSLTISLIGVYRRSNWNLAFPILFHFFNNFIVFIYMLYTFTLK